MDCNCKKNDKKACNNTFTKAVVENINPERFVDFRKVIVPASMGDDVANPPVPGKYCNVLLYYEANEQVYLYSSDGIPTKITVDIEALKKQLNKVEADLATETEERKEEDQKIWDEIEVIEAASDVVDVVGTYAELQQYDTSKLHDKDLIKVLQDETHDDAISYYRYSTSTHAFSYVGSEGPYYTESQVDTLLGGKQDTLIAGSNIQIASDGKTISATDTTYSNFTGATSLADGTSGLVPAPTTTDVDKFLKGDGTWETAAANTIFYANSLETGSTRHIYKNADMTGAVSMQDIIDANELGQVILRMSLAAEPTTYNDAYLQNIYVASGDYQALFLDNNTYYGYDSTVTSATTFDYGKRELQSKIIAGTNISIATDGKTISATDTTYTAGTGISISAQNVISATGGSGGATYVYYELADIEFGNSMHFYSDIQAYTDITIDDIYAAYQDGPVILVGVDGSSNPVAYSELTSISENSGDYVFTFYLWQYEQSDFKVYRIDGTTTTQYTTADVVKTDISGGTKVFYYDYDAALAAASGAQISLYTGYEPSTGLDSSTEIDSDGDMDFAMDGVTSAVLVGIYDNSGDYYIKCADAAISSAGSENYSSNIVSPYLSIIKDELPTKQIWKWGIDGNDDLCLFKSDLQPGTMVGATSLVAGSAGLVPAPTTSDVSKVLAGDGTWVSLPSANNISSNDWSTLWL